SRSRSESKDIVQRASAAKFVPDVDLARVGLYDNVPLMVSEALGCRLILVANAELQYECCDIHRTSVRTLVRRFEGHLLRSADGIYVVSSMLAGMLHHSYGLKDESLLVVPNGYARDLYRG